MEQETVLNYTLSNSTLAHSVNDSETRQQYTRNNSKPSLHAQLIPTKVFLNQKSKNAERESNVLQRPQNFRETGLDKNILVECQIKSGVEDTRLAVGKPTQFAAMVTS